MKQDRWEVIVQVTYDRRVEVSAGNEQEAEDAAQFAAEEADDYPNAVEGLDVIVYAVNAWKVDDDE